MRSESELLAAINKDLPEGIDWKLGAKQYLKEFFRRNGKEASESYLFTKPFAVLYGSSEDGGGDVFLDLMSNFINVLSLLKLPPGSRVLDVACGAGWLSHFLTKLGFEVVGIDVCQDLLEYARRRLKEDRWLPRSPEEIDRMFLRVDLESEPVPVAEPFDAAVFESCLHHFQNPIGALRHVAQSLKTDGVAVVIEGENRAGPIRNDFATVMADYSTIERPYYRSDLIEVFHTAGFPYYEFFCPVNGWYSPRGPATGGIREFVSVHSERMNRAVCTKSPAAMHRMFPWWSPERDSMVRYAEGFSEGVDGRVWSGPSSCLEISKACARLEIEVGVLFFPPSTQDTQTVSIYSRRGLMHQLIFESGTPRERSITLNDLEAEPIYFASDRLFCPAWRGENDSRILSFWIRVLGRPD